jgi:D-citramalate synthase
VKWGIVLSDKYPENVRFLDTTLRDGEQTPGISLTPFEKVEIAEALDLLGVQVIEAGFAAVSPGEREAVELISEAGFDAEICSAARSVAKDIDIAIDAGVDSVNIIIPVSELHIKRRFNKNPSWILDVTSNMVEYAKERGVMVEICLEDGSRTGLSFLEQVIQMAVEAGVDRVTPCDTVGTFTPEASLEFYRGIHELFPELVLGVHAHNDFGLATANTIAGVAGGATHIHATINGLGERAGNASLEESCVALEMLYKVNTGINMERITETSHKVGRVTGMQVQHNKAIVGRNAFAHESGIHTHAILRDPSTYERIDPSLVGATRMLVSGKHAGSSGLLNNLKSMGLKPREKEFSEILEKIKALGDQGNLISDMDLYRITAGVMGFELEKPLVLEEFIVTTGNKITPTASIKLQRNGERYMEASTGNGPVDATLNALVKAVSLEEAVELELYQVEAITGGTDARVNVEVRLRQGERVITSRGVDTDIVLASVNAYLNGVNLYQSMEMGRGKK